MNVTASINYYLCTCIISINVTTAGTVYRHGYTCSTPLDADVPRSLQVYARGARYIVGLG